MRVFKFGGASVKNAPAIINLGSLLEPYRSDRLFVVVSAMDKTTNRLEVVVKNLLERNHTAFENSIQEIQSFHEGILQELPLPDLSRLSHEIQLLFEGLRKRYHDPISEHFGFEYDQRIDRSYSLNPFASTIGLWGQARALTNQHILDFDKPWNPIVDVDSFGFPLSDTVLWNRLIASNQSMFDKNLRASLGRGPSDFIQIDDLNPDQLKLSYFSADELLNAGNSFV
ncbi:MAG: hypothetical protein EBR54_07410, partial [Flavobacteriia bacterium]|nr:hypothetical protein [Flavobacteriia bacterium]